MKPFLYKTIFFIIPILFLLGIPSVFLIYTGESFSKIEEVVASNKEYLIGYAYKESN